jgi:hypothetical protein
VIWWVLSGLAGVVGLLVGCMVLLLLPVFWVGEEDGRESD